MSNRIIEKNLLGLEDFVLGVTSQAQTRDGVPVTITTIRGTSLPFDDPLQSSISFVLVRAAISTWLGDATNIVNTNNKFAGREVFDTTLLRPVWATGPNPTDDWVDYFSAIMYTPS